MNLLDTTIEHYETYLANADNIYKAWTYFCDDKEKIINICEGMLPENADEIEEDDAHGIADAYLNDAIQAGVIHPDRQAHTATLNQIDDWFVGVIRAASLNMMLSAESEETEKPAIEVTLVKSDSKELIATH